jgi:hypothetical protein
MDFDSVKRTIDASVQNADSNISVETGTVTNLIISGAAVPIAAVYGYADTVGLKPFVDVCSPQDLLRHAKIKGVVIRQDMDDDDIRRAVLTACRIPPSGADLFSWENEISRAVENMQGVKFRLFENEQARGVGSVDVVLSHTASDESLNEVRSTINAFRPFGLADLQVSRAVKRDIELKIQVRGRAVSFQALREAILQNYDANGCSSIGESIYETKIYGIASNFGVTTAVMSWKNAGNNDWILGGCEAKKNFKDKFSVYEQLICTECSIEEL